jgi:hypothetical protein
MKRNNKAIRKPLDPRFEAIPYNPNGLHGKPIVYKIRKRKSSATDESNLGNVRD